MKIKILGTAAYERVPALFCNCGVCEQARKLGGKNVRTQAQTVINDDLLVDFGQDNYIHYLKANRDYTKIKNILITHSHPDHFMPNELNMLGGAYGHNDITDPICIYGNAESAEKYLSKSEGTLQKSQFCTVKPYDTFTVGSYEVTALPAYHGTVDPLCYIIKQGDKTLLYNNDSGVFFDEVYDFIKRGGYKFDAVIADCTAALLDWVGKTHMSLIDNDNHKEKLSKIGALKENTLWIITHYSHNALFENGSPVTAERMEEIAVSHGMISAYDGMEIIL